MAMVAPVHEQTKGKICISSRCKMANQLPKFGKKYTVYKPGDYYIEAELSQHFFLLKRK